jgi:hypothetical protein
VQAAALSDVTIEGVDLLYVLLVVLVVLGIIYLIKRV